MCNSIKYPLSVFFCGILLLSFVGDANDERTPSKFCESHSELAKSAMRARQSGAEMSTLINRIDDVIAESPDDKIVKSLCESTQNYIEQAYGSPLIHYEDMRQEAVLRFGNIIYRACYRELREARQKMTPRLLVFSSFGGF